VNPITDPRPGATSASVADDNRATALEVSAALQDAGIVAVSTGPITIAKLADTPDVVLVLMDDVIYDGIDAIG